jgi:internalin A
MEDKPLKLIKVVKELNIGMGTIVDFLEKRGYKVEKQPMAKITQEMFELLSQEFNENPITKISSLSSSDITSVSKDKVSYSGVELALENIKICLELKSIRLDLGNCALSSADFEVGSILHKELTKCTHITELSLSSNYWKRDDVNKSSKRVSSLNKLKPNFLTEIPQSVSSLRKLNKLICCGEKSYSWHIKDLFPINKLVDLTYLDLSFNEISSVKNLHNLHNLKDLILHHNYIKTFDVIMNLKSLNNVDLHKNQIEVLPFLKKDTSIVSVDLHDNQIKKFDHLSKYKNLKQLFLNSNQIESIDGFESLLTMNDTFYLKIDNNPFVPEYQLRLLQNENHLPFIKEILQRRADQSNRSHITYPIKILVFGNHSAGKSTVVNAVTGAVQQGSTHILRIVNYNLKTETKNLLPDAVFFDFGGQDFYHGVYRAFISEGSLQLILFNLKTDKIGIDVDNQQIPIVNYNRKYWLGQKKFQEKESSSYADYIMIQTFADKDNEAPIEDYQNYAGYKKSFFLSYNEDETNMNKFEKESFDAGRVYFKSYLNSLIANLQEDHTEPEWYVNFLRYIFDKKGKGHEATRIDTIFKNYNPNDSSSAAKDSLITNLTLLHRHGLVLYYQNIKGLENFVWLNPEKLVEYIQSILNKIFANLNEYSKPGIISKNDFEAQVADEKILLLLKEQQVIFLHKPTDNSEDNEYIIPNYLPLLNKSNIEAQLFTFGLESPDFVIKFDRFIPFGLINQMICFFGKQPDAKIFWRNQLLFTLAKEIRILIELDFEALMIKVHIHCIKKVKYSSERITEYLFFSIMNLYWNKNPADILSFSEFIDYKALSSGDSNENIFKTQIWENSREDANFIPSDAYVSIDGKNFVKCISLLKLEEDEYKISAYSIIDKQIDSDVIKQIPAGPFQPFTNKILAVMRKIFIAYSKFDDDYLQDFEDHLVTLKEQGIATFNCQKIEFGKEWDDEIKKQLDESDIMICLVSAKFLNTRYITEVEIPRAIDQNKTIIPIIIKSCDWENSKIGKFQAARRGQVVAMDNGRKLFGEIRAQTSEERDAFWTDIVKELRAKLDL